jgi:hypothetical protein
MANSKTTALSRKAVDMILTSFGVVATLALIVLGGLAWWAYSFTTANVHDELAAQRIYFPPAGSPALASSDVGPYLNKYAGQQLLTGPQARAYANHFIAVHLTKVAGGQTYSEASTKAMAAPTDAKLQGQVNTLFKGEALRGMLLNAYAFWTIGYIAQLAAMVCFAAAGALAVLTLLGFWHMTRV